MPSLLVLVFLCVVRLHLLNQLHIVGVERIAGGLDLQPRRRQGIAGDNQLMSDLEHAVEGARKKGAKDVAIIGSQGVFIVNVPNNMVVTTMSQQDMRERVFTNIDSAVIM